MFFDLDHSYLLENEKKTFLLNQKLGKFHKTWKIYDKI